VSYDVLLQQKTGVMTKGVVSGGRFDFDLTSSPAYNVEPVTNTLSITSSATFKVDFIAIAIVLSLTNV